jgi:hypothetical protein
MNEDAPTRSHGLVRLTAVAASFVAFGLLDGLFATLSGGPSGAGAMLSTLLVTVGLWVLLGCACWAGLSLAALGPGPSGLKSAWDGLRETWTSAETETDTS